ncbi:flavin reductase domain protein FMN-binding protein [Kribbella flavida DSM 17836]|uniref:Flavin reductase domain protein FMN-binding protein n=1 Tax=Kribbella flavida (strain DSM 17836 / JCM 10339 / NBRC 14399) TaxID=479435 RepID=D2Q044_KRIFD|nr:flavin reductase domain protein FMN-binding protein [Kribbella flavida DSM 17836]
MDVDPDVVGGREFYAVLNSVVVPRPIAWVSSVSADGVLNLAPHSFFTVACVRPPMVQFTSVGRKDSLTNVEATGEFVVNFAAERLFEQVNATGTNFPAGVSEFEAVGLTPEPARAVAVPRVAESPVAIECTLHTTLELGDSTVVIGHVRHLAIASEVMDGDHPDIQRLRPLARLGKDEWSTLGEVRAISRIRYDDWPGHFAPKQ